MGMFVISKRHNGDYKFVFTSRKGKPVFTSISCKQKSDCEMIIHAIRDHIEVFTITRKCTVSGKFFFRLSKGGLVLATSRKFSTELRLAKGIEEVMRNVPDAETLDFSVNEFVFPETETSAIESD
ncbi:YegP family protein [Sinomicrobium sp. M5D2P9]